MATAILKGGPAIKRKAAAKKPAAKKVVAKKVPSPRATIAVPGGKMADLMDQVRSAAGIGAKPGEVDFNGFTPDVEAMVSKDDFVKQPETTIPDVSHGFTSQTPIRCDESGFVQAAPSGADYATKPSLPSKPAEPKPVYTPPKPQTTNTFVSGMGTTFRLR